MSDDKPKPVDDLKEGLGLLFRAAKGAVDMLPTDKIESAAKEVGKEVGKVIDKLPTDKIEGAAKDAAKEVGRAFESIGTEFDRAFKKSPSQPAAPPPATAANAAADAPETPKEEVKYDDGYAPEPPKGPRVG